jgi:hypothetical protein
MDYIVLVSISWGIAWGIAMSQWFVWRKRAHHLRAFIENPNVKAVDKEAEYKDSYEAKINALEDERREQHEAMLEVFDVLNDLPSNPDRWPVEQIQQSRNVLLRAIQNSTYGR